ncbi:hypothetical protein PHET_09749 [Paragonimus heterotremus]|uniref:Uncharacterized protein n=1 Tax=Paragonimus heterotremus TaxID=100268 RepID=A0A8J4SLR5_9TREM|nr:hypothetical protein PHET_09749 [Paragonimus heterotremus]
MEHHQPPVWLLQSSYPLSSNDIKIRHPISSVEDCHMLQTNLTTLYSQSAATMLCLNSPKWKVFHHYCVIRHIFHLRDASIIQVLRKRVLGSAISSSLFLSDSCHYLTSIATCRLGILLRALRRTDFKLFAQGYLSPMPVR